MVEVTKVQDQRVGLEELYLFSGDMKGQTLQRKKSFIDRTQQ
jgi:hypothetical protein